MSSHPLLQHAGYLRDLARHLVGEEALAEDAVQETWLAALRRPPTSEAAARPWLNRVLRRILSRTRHSAQDRRWHEAAAARPEAAGDPGWLREREETIEHVNEAVSGLGARGREVILLRFYEGLAPREIAARLELPVETVRTRLKRALAELRSALDRRHGGDRGAWCAALLPFARLPRGALGATGPAASPLAALFAMSTTLKTLLVAGSAAIVVAGLMLPVLRREAREPDLVSASPPAEEVAALAAPPALVHPEVQAAAAAAQRRVVSVESQAAPAPPASRRGRVLDARGRPVDGLRLWFESGSADAVESDARGRFELAAEGRLSDLLVAPPFVVVRYGWNTAGDEVLIVVVPGVDLTGTVLDAQGAPLEEVRVELCHLPLVDFPESTERTARNESRAAVVHSDRHGRFAMRDLPAGYAALRLVKHGYETLSVPIGEQDDGEHAFTLVRRESELCVLTGTVLDHRSWTVPDALVALGRDNGTRSDETGFFRIEFLAGEIPPEGANLVAAKAGHRTAVIDGFGAGGARPTSHVEISLGGPTLEIAGRLLDADGNGHAGARVLLWGEDYVTGDSTAEELAVEGDAIPLGFSMQATSQPCVTDARGAFVLRGLADRFYRLRLIDLRAGLAMTSRPVHAGREDVVIRVPPDAYRETVSGRVINSLGAAMPGVEVLASVNVVRNANNNSWRRIKTTHTDEDGCFELHELCRLDTVIVRALGEDLLDARYHLEPDDPGTDITLVVVSAQRCRFRVELDDPARADGFRILDERGERLEVFHFGAIGGDKSYRNSPAPLHEGKSPIFSTSSRAATLVLAGEHETRIPIRLVPGEVTVLRP